jgi:voltage-gated potassium channel
MLKIEIKSGIIMRASIDRPNNRLRQKLYDVIFEADTPAGKFFDLALMATIVVSIIAVLLESVSDIRNVFGRELRFVEFVLTGLFTIEYILRLLCVPRPIKYMTSFFGIVDLVSLLPTFFGFYFEGTHSLLVLRSIRLLRVFRILKLGRFLGEAHELYDALKASAPKITVFLGAVVTVVLIMGATMYLIEGEENGFTSIPRSMYWAVVTMTTVGYGDIAPVTALGQALASVLMIMGYGVIAVPTGIVSAQLSQKPTKPISNRTCDHCFSEDHDSKAVFCKDCGSRLPPTT